ncbi:hypothetical protein I551_4252 [Mycobacterium ulcerans str. Harvey]|uniref:Uncharacterized protein n=1 Tax=Mycobacterium ulcerans str. Harvey TaxID=1299332 RepID=A0ABN0QX28_MYCUL|nr:hypothetical protein I551_4252 [Mycobacterium ulcerans str. Harvey]
MESPGKVLKVGVDVVALGRHWHGQRMRTAAGAFALQLDLVMQ